MKHIILVGVIIGLTSPFILTRSPMRQPSKTTGNLHVIVKNIRNSTGQIGFCLFTSGDGFPNHPEKALTAIFIKVSRDSTEYTFKDIPMRSYAISVFHDENSDKKVNSNFIGIPKEGIGVSNNAKGHFGPPKFDEAKFEFNRSGQTVTIMLTYL